MKFKLALFNASDFSEKSRFTTLGLAYIASYLRKYSDFKETFIIEDNILSKLRSIKPNVIGISSATQSFEVACSIASMIKSQHGNIPVIIGGYHISALAHTLPEVFDAAVLGEGEVTILELLSVINKFGISKEKLSEVKGLAFHDGGKVIINSPRAFIKEIDSIPHPDRDLIKNVPFFSSMVTSRGCPYRCIFCASSQFWGSPRFHSPEYVVEEIEELTGKYKSAHISIWDDLFVADLDRFRKIVSLVRRNRINKRTSFGCALRSNIVTPELCSLLKAMNVTRVSLGLESGSQKILNKLKCGSVTVEQHIRAVELCKSNGLFVTGTFMIGSPNENEEDLNKTFELIKKLKLSGGGSILMATPLPGTKLWEYATERKLVNEGMDFSRLGIMSTDFSKPESFRGVFLSEDIQKDVFFKMAQKIQALTNKYYLNGLLRKEIFSIKSLKFFVARPKEVLAIILFAIKHLLRKSSLMDRYVFYYKKPMK